MSPARAGALAVLALAWSACATTPTAPPSLEAHVRTLAAPELAGRLTGTAGERAAADYLVAQLQRIGARPLPGRDDLRLEFEFAAGTRDAGSSLAILESGAEPGGGRVFRGESELRALSFSSSGVVEAPVAFAGYGLRVPETQDGPYDSFAGLDLEGKVALVLRYFPEDLPDDERLALSRYAGLRYKALAAREHGAAALLVATGPRSPNAGETIPMTLDTAVAGSGIVAASVSDEVAEALFAHVEGATLEAVQAELDRGNPHAGGFEIPGLRVRIETRVERERRRGTNVVGLLPATRDAPPAKPYVVVGAHYDHLGSGRHGSSLARGEERGGVHHGADDNASGVAAVLCVAERLASRERARHVVVALWSGEELGLLGSSDFVDEAPIPAGAIAGYVNFDMVGRVRENRLVAQAVGSSPAWPALLESANVPVGLDLVLLRDPYLPTDSASFDRAEVPTLNFFSGPHTDYHRPSDTPEKLDYEALRRVAKLGTRVVAALARAPEPPEFARVERRATPSAGRDAVRAYTGTIPDYTSEAPGLALSGVVEGGPAEAAGLRAGDVIVEFGGRRITNIYDYTFALDVVKIGEPLRVVYLRNGERRETRITPRAR